MLLPIAHDNAQLIDLGIDGLSVPVHRSAVQNDLLLEISTRTNDHSEIFAPWILSLNAPVPQRRVGGALPQF